MQPPCPQSSPECTPTSRRRKGLCDKHYRRWRRHGSVDIVLRRRAAGDDSERWQAKVRVTQAGCWEWTEPLDRHGYGQYGGDRFTTHRAHRYIYQLLVTELTDEQTLDHLCRNRACVNPDHLEPVAHKTNVERGESGVHNGSKTHCKQGHEFTPENTYVPPRGGRSCRECTRRTAREAQRKKRGTPPDAIPNGAKTHCKQGHEFTPENTYLNRGKRCCRTCNNESQRRYAERVRSATSSAFT